MDYHMLIFFKNWNGNWTYVFCIICIVNWEGSSDYEGGYYIFVVIDFDWNSVEYIGCKCFDIFG